MARQGLGRVTKRLLRAGIVLLGFSVSFGAIAALGLGTIFLLAGYFVRQGSTTSCPFSRRARSGPRRGFDFLSAGGSA